MLEPNLVANLAFRNVGLYLVVFISFGLISLLVILPAVFGAEGEGRYRWFSDTGITTWLG